MIGPTLTFFFIFFGRSSQYRIRCRDVQTKTLSGRVTCLALYTVLYVICRRRVYVVNSSPEHIMYSGGQNDFRRPFRSPPDGARSQGLKRRRTDFHRPITETASRINAYTISSYTSLLLYFMYIIPAAALGLLTPTRKLRNNRYWWEGGERERREKKRNDVNGAHAIERPTWRARDEKWLVSFIPERFIIWGPVSFFFISPRPLIHLILLRLYGLFWSSFARTRPNRSLKRFLFVDVAFLFCFVLFFISFVLRIWYYVLAYPLRNTNQLFLYFRHSPEQKLLTSHRKRKQISGQTLYTIIK